MIMGNRVLPMIIDTFLKKENKTLMDILIVFVSMRKSEMILKIVLMDILMVMLSMKNKINVIHLKYMLYV